MVKKNVRKRSLKKKISIAPRNVRKAEKKVNRDVTVLGSALRTLGGLGGSAVGSLFGMPSAGASIGSGLGASLSKWLGSGDYEVAQNSILKDFRVSGNIPMMHRDKQSVVVRHREYIGDITAGLGAPTVFDVSQNLALNPGLSASFPWLSTVAQNFQEYTWRGLIFHYVPTSGNSVASTNTALGNVMMATNYRATAPVFSSKVFMLNEYFSTDARPSEAFAHPIECDPAENPYNVQYVRSGPVPDGEDPKTYDLGVTSIATQGIPAASTILGELWCSYEVELRKPIPVGILGFDNQAQIVLRGGTITTSTSLFGTITTSTEPLDFISSVNPTNFSIKEGFHGSILVELAWKASGVTAWATPTFTLTNCSAVLTTTGLTGSTVTAAGGYNIFSFIITVPNSAAQATVTSTSNVFTGTVADMQIRAWQVKYLEQALPPIVEDAVLL